MVNSPVMSDFLKRIRSPKNSISRPIRELKEARFAKSLDSSSRLRDRSALDPPSRPQAQELNVTERCSAYTLCSPVSLRHVLL